MLEAPKLISSVISELWRKSYTDEGAVFSSPTFAKLEKSCLCEYRGIPGSRLDKNPTASANPNELQTALQNFFRWNGAPWYGRNVCTASKAAQKLHQAFLTKKINRYYLVPLDCFGLKRDSRFSHGDKTDVSFGPNEIVCLDSSELGKLVRSQALKRFGPHYTFPTKELDEFYWLLVTRNEEAGSIWFRTWLNFLHFGSIFAPGTVPIFEPIFPTPIEDALFVMLLTFVKKLDDLPWQPFYVPWYYSFTDDWFADAMRAPDPSALTRRIVGPPGKEFEVPERSTYFSIKNRKRKVLRQRWCRLQACLQRVDDGKRNFNLLTKRFFVKGFVDNGIDQLISNVSCIEATLQLNTERSRENLMKRYLNLTGDKEAHKWLNTTYKLRNQYLHSLVEPQKTVSWEEFAKARWSVTKAMKNYLDLTNQHSELERDELLQFLLRDEPN